jgi:hypothetical protein
LPFAFALASESDMNFFQAAGVIISIPSSSSLKLFQSGLSRNGISIFCSQPLFGSSQIVPAAFSMPGPERPARSRRVSCRGF